MTRKPKFKPSIKRVGLNPEQAVLSCSCYTRGKVIGVEGDTDIGNICDNMGRTLLPGFCVIQPNTSIS